MALVIDRGEYPLIKPTVETKPFSSDTLPVLDWQPDDEIVLEAYRKGPKYGRGEEILKAVIARIYEQDERDLDPQETLDLVEDASWQFGLIKRYERATFEQEMSYEQFMATITDMNRMRLQNGEENLRIASQHEAEFRAGSVYANLSHISSGLSDPDHLVAVNEAIDIAKIGYAMELGATS